MSHSTDHTAAPGRPTTVRTGLGWNAKSSWLLDRHQKRKKNAARQRNKNLRFLAFEWSILPGCHKWLRKWTPGRFANGGGPSDGSPPPVVLMTASPPPKPPRISTRRPPAVAEEPLQEASNEAVEPEVVPVQTSPVVLTDIPENKPSSIPAPTDDREANDTHVQLEEAKNLWRYWQSVDCQVRRRPAIVSVPVRTQSLIIRNCFCGSDFCITAELENVCV